MFIAAFVAGLSVQIGFDDAGKHSGEFTEEWGQVLNLSVFFLFGILAAGGVEPVPNLARHLRSSEPHGYPYAAGKCVTDRQRAKPRHDAVYGLVRPSRAGVPGAGIGLSRTTVAST